MEIIMRRIITLGVFALMAGTAWGAPPDRVEDIALCANFQGPDFMDEAFAKGRALVAADFDLDGRVDFYMGNPGDQSFVVRNVPATGFCDLEFELVQELFDGKTAWGGAAADYDNDGDYDLFVACGGNEHACDDMLFQNQFIETGTLSFVDVTAEAGVATYLPNEDLDGNGTPGESKASGNAVWVDADRDGWVDLFVNGNNAYSRSGGCKLLACARNTLWRNNADGTFTDVTADIGIGITSGKTRNSTFLDVDNDGDMDLYEMNFLGANVLWRNLVVETGTLSFEDVTMSAAAPGERLAEPFESFGSCAGDFDNDGNEDILVSARGPRGVQDPPPNPEFRVGDDCGGENIIYEAELGTYPLGHALFMNRPGGFVNEAFTSRLNDNFIRVFGVMGFQIGDLDADGRLDVAFVNGAPRSGNVVALLTADITVPWGTLAFDDRSPLVNTEIPLDPNVDPALYPEGLMFRGHGTAWVDLDNDGLQELAISNGGASFPRPPDPNFIIREPNRIFKFGWDDPPNSFRVRPVGDGVNVSRDGIGTKVAVTVTDTRNTRTIYRTLYGGSCFSAQNGFQLFFGLGDDDTVTIDQVEITWNDGVVDTITTGLVPNTELRVERGAIP